MSKTKKKTFQKAKWVPLELLWGDRVWDEAAPWPYTSPFGQKQRDVTNKRKSWMFSGCGEEMWWLSYAVGGILVV